MCSILGTWSISTVPGGYLNLHKVISGQNMPFGHSIRLRYARLLSRPWQQKIKTCFIPRNGFVSSEVAGYLDLDNKRNTISGQDACSNPKTGPVSLELAGYPDLDSKVDFRSKHSFYSGCRVGNPCNSWVPRSRCQ